MLSDLHIWGTEDPLYRALIRFLKEELKSGDTLFIVGDLFDIFIGSKQVFIDKYQELIGLMVRLSNDKSVDIYYLEGNHDFLLSGVFGDAKGISVLSRAFQYKWNNRIIYFCHGDEVNPKDYKYKFWKFILHNPITKAIIALAPGKFVDQVGVKLSAASRSYNPQVTDHTIRLFRNYACEQIKKGQSFVVMGHSHHCDDIKFQCGDHFGQYVNVGFPRKDKRYIEIGTDDKYMQLKSWKEYINPFKS